MYCWSPVNCEGIYISTQLLLVWFHRQKFCIFTEVNKWKDVHGIQNNCLHDKYPVRIPRSFVYSNNYEQLYPIFWYKVDFISSWNYNTLRVPDLTSLQVSSCDDVFLCVFLVRLFQFVIVQIILVKNEQKSKTSYELFIETHLSQVMSIKIWMTIVTMFLEINQ